MITRATLPKSTGRIVTRRLHSESSASAKLRADAEVEERAEAFLPSKTHPHATVEEHPNWDGDESVQDAVLRMLIDKYKPLRAGSIQTAEDKIRSVNKNQPPFGSPSILLQTKAATTSASEPSLSAVVNGEHKPYLVTFKAPSHATISPAIKYGRVSSSPRASSSNLTPISLMDDPRARAEARRQLKLAAGAGRLTKARDSTLDYRLGGSLSEAQRAAKARVSPGAGLDAFEDDEDDPGSEGNTKRYMMANPVTIRAWNGLIEDKIERARAKGHFDNLKGRGKPILRDEAEGNPFIAREEFLMNRIVKRNNAAPPWVELQRELTSAFEAYRKSFQEAWTRRVIRALTSDQPISMLRHLSADSIAAIRDPEWESRESLYHAHLTKDLNGQIRRYNGVAPPAVRKPYVQLRAELDRCFKESVPMILEEIRARVYSSGLPLAPTQIRREQSSGFSSPFDHPLIPEQSGDHPYPGVYRRVADVIRRWFDHASS